LRPPKRIVAAGEFLGEVVRKGWEGQGSRGAGGSHGRELEVDELVGEKL
jgi:hypothetical protein